MDLGDEASEAAGFLGTTLPSYKRQATEPDEYMIMPLALCQAK